MDDIEPDGGVSDVRVREEQHHLGSAVCELGARRVSGDQDCRELRLHNQD